MLNNQLPMCPTKVKQLNATMLQHHNPTTLGTTNAQEGNEHAEMMAIFRRS